MELKDLENLELNKNEAKVYYELLKIGKATASQLVKKMGVHRNIIYDNLEKLIGKGLVSYIIQESKKLFIIQEPITIIEFLENKKEILNKKIEKVKKLIPEIENLRKETKAEQEAQIFRGIKGIKKVLAEILKYKENFVIGMTNKSTELLGEIYWENYNAKIKQNKIKEKFLLNSNFKDIYSFKKDNKNIDVKILPKEFDQVTEIIIFNGNVAIFVYSENPIVFLIKDKNLYETYLTQFQFLWKMCKK